MIRFHDIFKLTDKVVATSVFLILLATYWLTVPPTVSYWDCPEYVTAAVRLEVGHPPGNPVWMLVERVVTLLAPPEYAALAVNMSSGFFTALAGALLAKVIFAGAVWVLKGAEGRRRRLHALYAGGGALTGSLCFGWADSTWYSAVEAEVYAMSVFLTALSLWLMLKWATATSASRGWKYLVLLAYVFGLSVGVHQLNLLCIPALAMIWAVRRDIRSPLKLMLIFLLSLGAVACVLVGMMPSTIALASEFELFTVNTLHLPFLSGVAAYLLLLGASLLTALAVTARSHNKGVLALAVFPAIFLSGIFIVGQNYAVGFVASLMASMLLVRGKYFLVRRLNLSMWMLAMLLTGYSAYALIPIRGGVPAPPNIGFPGDPFSFAAYQAREQYGSTPLVYGYTPYSMPLVYEDMRDGDSTRSSYTRYVLRTGRPMVERGVTGAVVRNNFIGATPEDSAFNAAALGLGKDAYVIKGYNTKYVYTPELNMWFPRITSRDRADLDSYRAWIGMSPETMAEVRVSEAVDSAGGYVTRRDALGHHTAPVSYRPTYMQNLQFFASYQIYYMYLRYLLWNFAGRQNDIPSQGEVEHGNFISGITPLDNMMLEAEEYLPWYAGTENPGRNRYYMLPLLLGAIGIVALCRGGHRARQGCGVVAILFIMTGIAIVVYLNQSPGEPRERDYTFLGSYLAFCIWIGYGAVTLARMSVKLWSKILRRDMSAESMPAVKAACGGLAVAVCVPLLMLAQNYDDHDRSGRSVASAASRNILNSLKPGAILFVDGDNYTFPLWYAQEVEGVRRDVRVINLSYLTSPKYSAAVMRAWEDSPMLESVLKENDIIYNAYRSVSLSTSSGTEADALDALKELKKAGIKRLAASSLRLGPVYGDSVLLPAVILSRSGGSSIAEFRRLIMLDIIASNLASATPRPVYWMRGLSGTHFIGLQPYVKEDLFTYRLEAGGRDAESPDAPGGLIAPNKRLDAYMDATPGRQAGVQRAALTLAARRALERGDIKKSLELATFMIDNFGYDMSTYASVRNGDSVYRTGDEYVALMLDLARASGDAAVLKEGEKVSELMERRSIGWQRYKEHLSPHMRQNCTSR